MGEQVKDILPVVIAEIAENQANKQRAEYERKRACYQRRVAKVYKKSTEKIITVVIIGVAIVIIYKYCLKRQVEIKA